MLRDPATNSIPRHIRKRELNYSRTLPRRSDLKFKTTTNFEWQALGPSNVGGRTRALAVDVTDPNTIIAGGVSGGVWKSTDGGSTWQLKTDSNQNMSVRSLAQDPRPGHTDTWYYSSGEFTNNTASDQGFTAPYYGTGVFKSTDNGETWSRLADTKDTDTQFSSPFDYISKIVVNPQTGSVFIASNGFGILRSSDGVTFDDPNPNNSYKDPILGGFGEHLYADIVVAPNGRLVAALSQQAAGNSSNNPGIFYSDDDGDTWNEITPTDFPSNYQRTVVAIASSNPDIVYTYTYQGTGSGANEDISFFKIDINTGTSEDRSTNLPDFGGKAGFVDTQGNYNMVLVVHPDNPDFVVLGGTNLFRSTDGFSTTPTSNKDKYWIGGYTKTADSYASYPHQHADQHVVFFDPNNHDKMWSGHDGGISLTNDVTASSVQWTDKDNGYVTTQFYSVSMPYKSGDSRVMGGTQDNGTPFFDYTTTAGSSQSSDISSGDGGFSYFGDTYAYVSSQNGKVIRLEYSNGKPTLTANYAYVYPKNASGQLFINPYVVDPNNEDVMYYPAGDSLWRNTDLSGIPGQNSPDGTTHGWDLLNIPDTTGYNISALEISRSGTKHRLYYGMSNDSDNPILYKLDHADTTNAKPVNISIPSAMVSSGSYVSDIAINPANADEIIVTLSNYNIKGIFYSDDAGTTWTAEEGNLAGTSNDPGPSIRSASILPTQNGSLFVVGTSTGVYSTTTLNSSNTSWLHESDTEIGYAVTADIATRAIDGTIIAGTHGRGLFKGNVPVASGIANQLADQTPTSFALKQNYPNPFNPTTSIQYNIPQNSRVNLTVYNIEGRKVMELLQNKTQQAGQHNIQLDASKLSSGVYLYRLKASPISGGSQTYKSTKKMTLIK